jgi:hypothetical protein
VRPFVKQHGLWTIAPFARVVDKRCAHAIAPAFAGKPAEFAKALSLQKAWTNCGVGPDCKSCSAPSFLTDCLTLSCLALQRSTQGMEA